MVALARAAFAAGTAAALAIIGSILVTLGTGARLWPPGDDRRLALLHWALVGVVDASLVVVAALAWNSWVLPRPASLVVGVAFSLAGAAVFGRSVRAMDPAETTGQAAAELYTEGPYARSRNPQYVGMVVGLVGFASLVNAAAAAVLVGLHVCWLVLLPFAEEPWLRERFGDDFDRYCERVPRFVGLRSFVGR